MAVSATPYKESYAGDGVTTLLPVRFYFLQDSDLLVTDVNNNVTPAVATPLNITTDYTVTGAGVATGGAVTMLTAPAVGHTTKIERHMDMSQPTHFVDGDPLPAAGLEQALDRIVMQVQQIQTEVDDTTNFVDTTQLRTDLINKVSGAFAAALVWFDKTLTYTTGTVGAFLNDLGTAALNKGAALIGYLSPLAGAVAQTVASALNNSVSVKTFGAVGDGVADDSAAVAAAIASGIGRIYYPPGTYKIANVTLAPFQTHYGPGATITSSGSAFILPASATQHITFDGLTFSGTGNAIYTAGIYLNASWVIKNCSFGRTLAECIYVPLILSSIKYNHFGTNNGALGAQHRHLYMAATAASGVAINENTIIGNRFNSAVGAVASTFIQYGSGNTFIGNDWEGNTSTYTVHIDGGGVTNFYGNWFESNSSVQQVYMEATAAITATIYYNNAINFIGNTVNMLVAGNAAIFYLDSHSHHLSMVGNQIYTNQAPTIYVTNSDAGNNGGIVEFRNNSNYSNSFSITGITGLTIDTIVATTSVQAGGSSASTAKMVAKSGASGLAFAAVDSTDTTLLNVDASGQIGTGTKTSSPYNLTTASAANMFVASNGILQRSTSAAKYKTDVRDLESLDITKLRAVRYKSLGSTDDPTLDHFGLIADEALVSGFKELVTFGEDGEVEGFQYERLTAVLLKALQDLRKEFNDYKMAHGG